MKRVSSFALLGMVALVATVVAAPAVNAGCTSPNLWGQIDALNGGADTYHYVIFPPNTNTAPATVIGRCWESGNFNGNRCGNYSDEGWLTFSAAFQQWYLLGDNQFADIGCPFTEQTLVIETLGTGARSGQAFIIVARVNGTPADPTIFNYNRVLSDLTFQPIPPPTVTNRQQVGQVVTLDLSFPPASNLFKGAGPNGSNFATAITGYRVVRKNAAPPSQDTRPASDGWSAPVQTVASAGGTTQVSVDCATIPGQDALISTQLGLQDGQVSNYVSQAVLVKCS